MDDRIRFEATTIIAVRRKGKTAMAGDGQITLDETIIKAKAKKVRRLFKDTILAGFAGSAADALTLFDRFENQLNEQDGDLVRAVIELAREWRQDKFLHRLDALLTVADRRQMYIISGQGDILEPDDGIAAIGSGAPYALAAARALQGHTQLDAGEIARTALQIAAGICIYTNAEIHTETL